MRLLAAGLTDLRGAVPELARASGFYLSVPDPRRCYTGLDLIAHEETRHALAKEAMKQPEGDALHEQTQALLSQAAEMAEWRGRPDLRFATSSGHAGVAEAMERAIEDLGGGVVEEAIVGGVDSLLDERTLQWLHNTGRLKTDALPAGLQPGEACALTHLRLAPIAHGSRSALANVQLVRVGEESDPLISGRPSRATGLVEALAALAEPAGWRTADRAWLITDQNGESYRAAEWGNAVCRLARRYPAMAESVVWRPAASFGDTGAASGAISVCLAARALQRRYAPPAPAVATMCSDGPRRGALLIAPPN